METANTPMPALVHVRPVTDNTLLVQLAGNWQLQRGVPEWTEIQQQLDDTPRVRQLTFEVLDMPAWDTGLLTFLLQLLSHCQQRQIAVDQRGLPEGVRRLLALATAVPEREGARRGASRLSWLAQVGTATFTALRSAPELCKFIGEACLTFVRFALGKARYRRTDFVLLLCEFARKKENPPVKWYLKPLLGTVSYVLIPASDALSTIGSCSAELPVIRGRGHSHASRCLFVRDQETSLRFILLTVLAGCRHQESNEVAVATLFMPARVGPDPWRVPLPSFLSLYWVVLLGGKSHASCYCAV